MKRYPVPRIYRTVAKMKGQELLDALRLRRERCGRCEQWRVVSHLPRGVLGIIRTEIILRLREEVSREN